MPYAYTEDATALYYEIAGRGTPNVFIHPPVMGHIVFKHQKRLAGGFSNGGISYNSTHSLYRLKMTVLLVYGSQEKSMHHYRIPFQQHASNVKVVYIKGASHEVPPRHFPEFNGVVHQFLQSQKQELTPSAKIQNK